MAYEKKAFGKGRGESGQSMVEFALVAISLVVLLTIPVDLFRYINTLMTLNSATAEAASQLTYESLTKGTVDQDVLGTVKETYSDKLNSVSISKLGVDGVSQEEKYKYRVYSSDLESKPHFSDRFEDRDSNYRYKTVELQLTCEDDAITPLGALLFGDSHWKISGDTVRRNVYVGGYER